MKDRTLTTTTAYHHDRVNEKDAIGVVLKTNQST